MKVIMSIAQIKGLLVVTAVGKRTKVMLQEFL